MPKMTMKKWENSKADARLDKKSNLKEGSKIEQARDRAEVRKINSKKK